MHAPQPTPWENIIQNNVPPGPSNVQSTVKTRRQMRLAEIKKQFLACLDMYAHGYTLTDCSATFSFFKYVTDTGYLKPKGTTLYNKFEQADKNRIDQALESRKVFQSLRPYNDNSTRTRILEGLKAYANGVPLKKCSATIKFDAYFTTDGRLQLCGERLYNSLNQEDKDQVDQALKSREENSSKKISSDQVRMSFLEGLEAYASGAPLKKCSKTIHFESYASATGYLHEGGERLYARLEQEDKDRVINALHARHELYYGQIATDDTIMERFLEGLAAYASGAALKDCSATIKFSDYVTTDGRLLREGETLYKRFEGSEGEALINKALADRRRMAAEQISGDLPHFMSALEPYGNGLDLQACGKQSGLKRKVARYFTPEGGLTSKGELLIENLPLEQQGYVLHMLKQRRQHAEQSTQVQESPMQTEAMWATAWQLTGQAVPGPSTSAEPSIPYYNSGAVGAEFQYQHGP
ncbi:MAG: hypothetical protein P8X74_13485 [Reinekea sp.]